MHVIFREKFSRAHQSFRMQFYCVSNFTTLSLQNGISSRHLQLFLAVGYVWTKHPILPLPLLLRCWIVFLDSTWKSAIMRTMRNLCFLVDKGCIWKCRSFPLFNQGKTCCFFLSNYPKCTASKQILSWRYFRSFELQDVSFQGQFLDLRSSEPIYKRSQSDAQMHKTQNVANPTRDWSWAKLPEKFLLINFSTRTGVNLCL